MKKFIAVIFALITFSVIDAQIFTTVIDEQALQMRVKQIDEFFSRFNYECDFLGKEVSRDTSLINNLERRKNTLIALLNFDRYYKNNNIDSVAGEFIDFVIKENKRIAYTDTNWYAEVSSSFTMNGKKYPLTFILHTEQLKDVIYKWVIADVRCEQFDFLNDSINSQLSIFPGAHGASFISVPDAINLNTSNVRSFFRKDYKPDRLSLFEEFVRKRQIKIGSITKVAYKFNLGKYKFTVEHIEKGDSYNNGWLVNEIVKQ